MFRTYFVCFGVFGQLSKRLRHVFDASSVTEAQSPAASLVDYNTSVSNESELAVKGSERKGFPLMESVSSLDSALDSVSPMRHCSLIRVAVYVVEFFISI